MRSVVMGLGWSGGRICQAVLGLPEEVGGEGLPIARDFVRVILPGGILPHEFGFAIPKVSRP